MCGILAGIGSNIATELSEGLKRLEYRGYDSAGMAIIKDGVIKTEKAVGKFSELEKKISNRVEKGDFSGSAGIGHVRWATHGVPSLENSHPHHADRVSVVHNGIIENYLNLKSDLAEKGYNFYSDTDTEIVAKLVDSKIDQASSLVDALHESIDELEGAYSLVFLFKGEDELLFASRNKTPLILGLSDEGKDGNGIFLASDVVAFPSYIKRVIYLEDGDRVLVSKNDYQIFNNKQEIVQRSISISTKSEEVTKGDYDHFMMKEMQEQPEVLSRVFSEYFGSTRLDEIDIDWKDVSRIRILACGSAYYAGIVGRYWLEELTNLPVDAEIASEYRYRNNASDSKVVTLIISQSGETLDTLEALKKAKASGEKIISIVNVERSSIARESDFVLPILAGPEIGVASTKAFLAQLAVFSVFSLHVAKKRDRIEDSQIKLIHSELSRLPEAIKQILSLEDQIATIAESIKDYGSVLFLGRNKLYPIALEGALKLKELSYIHAEAYPGGELKHGPISLIDENMPIVCFIPEGSLADKMFANLQEVVARSGKVFSVVSGKVNSDIDEISTWSLSIPNIGEFVSPILFTVPMQILAYHVCNKLDKNADQPRNLAKSVTVE